MTSSDDKERYSRQILFHGIGEEGQERLGRATVLVVGCGALGSHISNHLARAGVGSLRIVDRDVVDISNLHRQAFFDEQDAESRLPKSEAARGKLSKINSRIRIEALLDDVNHRNVERFINGAHVVVDGTDNMETRYLLNDACVKHGIPWIYGGVLGSTGMCLTVIPGRGPCLACLFPESPPPGEIPTCDTAGILNTAPALVAAVEATEVQRLIVTDEPSSEGLLNVDLWTGEFYRTEAGRNESCSVCVQAQYEHLKAERTNRATTLCGRDAVQITPPEGYELDLERLRASLSKVGEVFYNGFILTFRGAEGIEMMIFPDGRTIFKGTTDTSLARSLHARYLGG